MYNSVGRPKPVTGSGKQQDNDGYDHCLNLNHIIHHSETGHGPCPNSPWTID